MGKLITINELNYRKYIDPTVKGEVKKCGTIPRDWKKYPHGSLMHAKPFDLPLIPESEWADRLAEQIANKSRMCDVRNTGGPGGKPIPARDQNGKGFCHPAGTPILMADGTEKRIERISVGDRVLAHRGVPRSVYAVNRRQYDGPIREFYAEGGSSVQCTDNHPIAFGGSLHPDRNLRAFNENGQGWVRASDFRPGDVAIRMEGGKPVARVLESVWDSPGSVEVHNIEVEGDHSYYAAGFSSHNCWAHSSVGAMLLVRAAAGEPYADLSAFAVACIIKQYRDEGGWGAESLEYIAQNGVPTSEFWPQQSMSRSNDNPAMHANAKLHRFTNWRDLDPANMKAQFVTCLLMGFPVVTDLDWWSHSIVTMSLVSLNPFKTLILNSWGDSWSDNGAGELEGDKAIPNSALCAMVGTASQG